MKNSVFLYHQNNLIRKALEKFKGNRTQTAEYLGISIRSLRNRINNFVHLQKWRKSKEEIQTKQKTNKDYLGRNYTHWID